MTPEERELVARLEAKLRGWDEYELVYGPDWLENRGDLRKWTAVATGCGWNLNRFVYPDGAMESRLLTDPTTPEGAWEWVLLLKQAAAGRHMDLELTSFRGGVWHLIVWNGDMHHSETWLDELANDPIAAVTAAVIAAAKQDTASPVQREKGREGRDD